MGHACHVFSDATVKSAHRNPKDMTTGVIFLRILLQHTQTAQQWESWLFFYSSFHVRNAVNPSEAQLTDTWCLALRSRLFHRQSSLWRLPSWLCFWQDAVEQAQAQRLRSNLQPAVPQNTVGFQVPLTRSLPNLSLGRSIQMTWYWCLPSHLVPTFNSLVFWRKNEDVLMRK